MKNINFDDGEKPKVRQEPAEIDENPVEGDSVSHYIINSTRQRVDSIGDDFDLSAIKNKVIKLVFQDQNFSEALILFQQAYNKVSGNLREKKWSEDVKKSYEEAIAFFLHFLATMREAQSAFSDNTLSIIEAELQKMLVDLEQELQKKIIETAGVDVRKAWEILLREYPELQQLYVKSKTASDEGVLLNTGGYFQDPGTFSTRISIVVVPDSLGNEHYRKLLKTRKKSIDLVIDKLQIEPEKMTPELLKLFIFVHEVGHAYDYFTNYANQDNAADLWKRTRREELATLPSPGIVPPILRDIIDRGETGRLPDEIRERINQGSKDEVLEEQEKAYRNLPSESFADQFAANFIKKHFLIS